MVSTLASERTVATDRDLVLVLTTNELCRCLFAKSLLERDSIEYIANGDAPRMAQGWNQSGLTDTPVEPVELWVRAEDADRARAALRELDIPPGAIGEDRP